METAATLQRRAFPLFAYPGLSSRAARTAEKPLFQSFPALCAIADTDRHCIKDGIKIDAGCGGAVYSASHNVVLNAGEIINNRADRQGGGAYVGSVPYSLTAYNAEITSNTASVIGGGAWFCPTGEASFSVNEGSAVYGNTADGAGDDIAAVRMHDNGAKTNVAERMLVEDRITGTKMVEF